MVYLAIFTYIYLYLPTFNMPFGWLVDLLWHKFVGK